MIPKFAYSSDRTKIHVRFEYDPDLTMAIKRCPGKEPVYEAGRFSYWAIPVIPSGLAPFKNFCKAAGIDPPPDLVELFDEVKQRQDQNLAGSVAEESTMQFYKLPESLHIALRPFQRAGVEYLYRNRRTILGDDMGLGKTIQAIAATEEIEGFPCLVICPASLKFNWWAEIHKWTPGRVVEVLEGKDWQDGRPASQYVIANYEILPRHPWIETIPWKTVIVDESHYIKNHVIDMKTGQYKTQRVGLVLEIAREAKNVFLLTGTPILNRPVELVTQLQAIGQLDPVFGGFWSFVKRYCEAYNGDHGWNFSGAADLDHLNKTLRRHCYIRRTKKAVLPELPDKTRSVIPLQINNRDQYIKAETELIHYIEEQGKLDKKFLAELDEEKITGKAREKRIKAYRQTKAAKAARAETLVKIETLKQIAAIGKMPMILDWVLDFLENNPLEKLVIFATHKDIIDSLQQTLIDNGHACFTLTGETAPEERQSMIDRFQDRESGTQVFVANIQAGGVGITLTIASHVLFVEYAWNAATMDQAEDRLHRIGQKNAVNVYWTSGINTIDETMIDLIESKRGIVERAGSDELQDIIDAVKRRIEK